MSTRGFTISFCLDHTQLSFKMTFGRHHFTVLLISVAMALSTVNGNTSNGKHATCHSQECKGDYDVVVLLDRSNKVGDNKSLRFIELIKKIVHLFDIKEDGSHFGLVLYNDDPQIVMKLNEDNNAAYIKNYLMTSLPGRKGNRNVRRALRATRKGLLTSEKGDRPDVPNICIVLTTGYGVRRSKQYRKIRPFCKFFFVLRKGGDADLQKVYDRVCLAPSANEAEANTVRQVCPLPYAQVGQYCFLVIFTQQPYNESLVECQERNGNLIKVDTEEKSRNLIQFTNALQVGPRHLFLYIGLRDETGDNADYHWTSDGSNLTFSNWLSTEPNVAAHRCAVYAPVSIHGGPIGAWFDADCQITFAAICETERLSLG